METRFLTRTQGSEEETIRVLEESGVAEYVDIDENGGRSLVLLVDLEVFTRNSWTTGTGERRGE